MTSRFLGIFFLTIPSMCLSTPKVASIAADQKILAAEHFDAECDTAHYYVAGAPSKASVDTAYEAATQKNTPLDVLVELCKPYQRYNPDLCVLEVFDQWERLCIDKELVTQQQNGVLFNLRSEFERQSEHYSRALGPVGASCLGLAKYDTITTLASLPAMASVEVEESPHALEADVEEFLSAPLSRYYTTYATNALGDQHRTIIDDFPAHHAARVKALSDQIQAHVPSLLPDLVSIIGSYLVPVKPTLSYILNKSGQSAQTRSDEIVRDNSIVSEILPECLPERLKELTLRNNRVSSLLPGTFAHQQQLVLLLLCGNFLKEIGVASLVGLTNLQRLDLSYNRIQSIQSGALLQLAHLRSLALQVNALDHVPSDIEALIDRKQLTLLELWGNPLDDNPSERDKGKRLILRASENVQHPE